jgi:hypothetical protein
MAAALAGGGPGGLPMEVAASVPDKKIIDSLKKLASQAKDKHQTLLKAGRFKLREPKTAQEAKLREEIKKVLRDLVR